MIVRLPASEKRNWRFINRLVTPVDKRQNRYGLFRAGHMTVRGAFLNSQLWFLSQSFFLIAVFSAPQWSDAVVTARSVVNTQSAVCLTCRCPNIGNVE